MECGGEEWCEYPSLGPLAAYQVRLVTILPSDGVEDAIKCSICRTANAIEPHAGLFPSLPRPRKLLEYTCLSYQWGAEEPLADMKMIELNGSKFRARSNLHHFLLKARDCDMLGPSWIDAMSINQEDVAERNNQVKMMGLIYHSATSVLLWLGSLSSAHHV